MPKYAPHAFELITNANIGSINLVLSFVDNFEDTVSQPLSDTKKATRVVSPILRIIEHATKCVPEAFAFPFVTVWRTINESFKDQDLPDNNAVEI
jgi:hypothetical protein